MTEQRYPVVYGFDPGLRHGSLVSVAGPEPYAYAKVRDWTKSRGGGMGSKATPFRISEFAQWFFSPIPETTSPGPIFIEYDKNSVYWRAQKVQVVTLAMFLGYFTGIAHTHGYPVVFLRSRDIRSVYGFSKGSKEEFQDHFLVNYGHYFSEDTQEQMRSLRGKDELDAIITGSVYFLADQETKEEEWEYLNG